MPRVVGESPLAEARHTAAEVGVGGLAGWRMAGDYQLRARRRGGQRVADASEPSSAGSFVRIEHLVEHVEGQGEVGVRHDAEDRCARRLLAGRREVRHGLGLTDRMQVIWAFGAVGRAALHEHRADHRRDGAGVGVQLLQQVLPEQPAQELCAPQVVVRVDDHALVGCVSHSQERTTPSLPLLHARSVARNP